MFPTLLAASPAQYLFGILLFIAATFLTLLVMVQRGRGGGLAGAFGGMGGQSAFGTKAGDVFTRITIGTAAVWILLCIATIVVLNRQSTDPLGRPSDAPGALGSPDGSPSGSEDAADGDAATTGEGGGDSSPAAAAGTSSEPSGGTPSGGSRSTESP